jgi:hypothetical protein
MWHYITHPGTAYNHLYTSYGWWGVAFAGMGIILVGIVVWLWLERRK